MAYPCDNEDVNKKVASLWLAMPIELRPNCSSPLSAQSADAEGNLTNEDMKWRNMVAISGGKHSGLRSLPLPLTLTDTRLALFLSAILAFR